MLDWHKPDTWSVLIVDDEPDNLELVAVYLSFLGATVKTAQNGQLGLDMLKTYHPNFILLDLSMPQMDGWEMHRAIRASVDAQDVMVFALTAHAMPKDEERVREAGFNGYLTKPLNLPNLLVDLENSFLAFQTVEEKTYAAK